MREILFRGKYLRTGDFVYGSFVKATDRDGNLFYHIEIADQNDHRVYEVDPDTVGQFTGLLDMNDEEIFEGETLNVSNMEFSHFQDSGIPDSPTEIFVDIQGEVCFSNGQFEVSGHSLGNIPLSAIDKMDMQIIPETV